MPTDPKGSEDPTDAVADEIVLASGPLAERGRMIALQHLWPYVDQLKKECGYTQAEIGAAFLIASYAALYGEPKPSREGHRKAFERINAILKRLARLKAIGQPSSLH